MTQRILSAALLALAIGCSSLPIEQADLIVIAPRMLDVRASRFVRDVAVVVRDGRITAIRPATAVNKVAATERLLLPAGTTLLPGLVDTHVHLAWQGAPAADAARATVMAGFTTVRNLGTTGDADLVLRNAIEKGEIIGPRMLIARTGIGEPGGICERTFGQPGVETAEQARERVRALVADGADLIKICTGGDVIGRAADAARTEMTAQTVEAIVQEARRYGRRVAAHAQGPAAIRLAALAGVDSIEHGGLIDEETARLLAARHIPLVPTLARLDVAVEAARARPAPPEAITRLERLRDDTLARVRRARELGVEIVFGTDGGVLPHGENAREFGSLTAIGMLPLEALRAATLSAARLLGRDDHADAIELGYDADLIAVADRSLTDLTSFVVHLVVARGRILKDLECGATRNVPNGRATP